MNQNQLDSMLGDETAWTQAPVDLWRQARTSAQQPSKWLGFNTKQLSPFATAAVLVLVGLAAFVMLLPALGKARSSMRVAPSVSSKVGSSDGVLASINSETSLGVGVVPSMSPESSRPQQPAATERFVIRKVSMELRSPDVRSVFARVSLLINEGVGEYIEDAQVSGEENKTQAQLTLRIAATRVGEVMTQLQGLGKVISQNTTGQDVTDQVVDIEARMRNELRIEKELLELLASRKDAPLKELLEVRVEVDRARERIERMQASRDKLSRLTSLATVLVLIRSEEKAPQPVESSWVAQAGKKFGAAFEDGQRSLTSSIAFLIEVIVGGLVWWIFIGGVIVAILWAIKSHHRRLANEPAPMIDL